MASFQHNNFFSSTVLHSSMVLPDDIWISRTEDLSQLKKTKGFLSISDINDSDLYSTVDDIDTTSLFLDNQHTSPDKSNHPSKKQKKIHFCDEIDQLPSADRRHSIDVKSIRSAIDRLEDDQPTPKISKLSFLRRRGNNEPQVQAFVHKQGEFDEHRDSFSTEFNNLMRMASHSTKKVFRKLTSGELVASKSLWRRNHGAAEGGSSESLSSAGPSALYHLPQDMSLVSNSPGRSSGTSDMDTPFNGARTRTIENYCGQGEQNGHGLLRRKASGALKYVQKWNVASVVGGLIHKRTRNDGTEAQGGESAWHSTSTREEAGANISREDSLRKRLARSLSF